MSSELRGFYRKFLSLLSLSQGLVEADADTAWKRSNDTARKNVAYKLINLRGNGELQRIYRNDGGDALREYIKCALPKYLYHDGKRPGCITRREFARYRHRLSKKIRDKVCRICEEDNDWVKITYCDECGGLYHIHCLNPILPKVPEGVWFCNGCDKNTDEIEQTDLLLEDKLRNDETVAEVRDHAACWNLKMRGVVGETPLHICYLSGTTEDKEIAKILLGEFPYMVYDIYEGTTFFGENALHFAVVRKDMESAKLLLHHSASLIARGRGTFFQPVDINSGTSTPDKTNFKGNACYGEYPLAFAASMGFVKMYDYFIKQSKKKPYLGQVNPNARDSFGNTVLHWCVIHKQKKMYKHAIRHPELPADQTITNYSGLTPLALACRLGHCDMFEAIVTYSSKPLWTHGVTCLACPLHFLDSIDTDGIKNETSALRIIVKGSSPGHFKMLESSVVVRLLDEKWKRYVKRRFLLKFAWTFVHLALLFIATQLRPDNSQRLVGPTDSISVLRYIMEIGVVIGCTAQFLSEGLEMKLLKPRLYLQNLFQVSSRLIFCTACFLIYACVIFRFTGHTTFEELTLMIAIPCSWSYIFFFYRGTETLGPYVVMIGKMLTGDILQFWVIMSTFLVLFATVFYFLFLDGSLDNNDGSNEGFSLPWRAFISLFGMTFGNFDYTEFYKSRMNWFSTLLFVSFMIISPILLLNMLIAMMAKTYDEIRQRARDEWKRQWTRIILVMEGAVPRDELIHYQSKYSADVPLSLWSEQPKERSDHRQHSIEEEDHLANSGVVNPMFELDNEQNKDVSFTNIEELNSTKTEVEEISKPRKDGFTNIDPDSHMDVQKSIKALLIIKAIDKRTKKRRKHKKARSKENERIQNEQKLTN